MSEWLSLVRNIAYIVTALNLGATAYSLLWDRRSLSKHMGLLLVSLALFMGWLSAINLATPLGATTPVWMRDVLTLPVVMVTFTSLWLVWYLHRNNRQP